LSCYCPQEGDKVTAGTVNCDGAVIVRAEHSGQDTVIADIVRMVEMAQARGQGRDMKMHSRMQSTPSQGNCVPAVD
jgi:hypothetical protein